MCIRIRWKQSENKHEIRIKRQINFPNILCCSLNPLNEQFIVKSAFKIWPLFFFLFSPFSRCLLLLFIWFHVQFYDKFFVSFFRRTKNKTRKKNWLTFFVDTFSFGCSCDPNFRCATATAIALLSIWFKHLSEKSEPENKKQKRYYTIVGFFYHLPSIHRQT